MTKKYPCRCLGRIKIKGLTKTRACNCRTSLSKHPDDYVRPRKCLQCGSHKWGIDKYRMRNEHGKSCLCSGLHFPHRKGCKYCEHHPRHEQDWSERAGEVKVEVGNSVSKLRNYEGFVNMIDTMEAI